MLSLAFRPFPKDNALLSVYDGSRISPQEAWKHYTGQLGYDSAGVWAVSTTEVEGCELSARPDPLEGSPDHAVIDFTKHERKAQEAKSKILAERAEQRGCAFRCPV